MADIALLLTPKDVEALIKVSPRKLRAMKSAGELPKPVMIGRLVRYRRADIEKWVAAGCPALKAA